MPSPFFRIAGIVSPAGLPSLSSMDIAPALSAKPLTSYLAQPFAQWSFGPDATSLASLSSGHTAAATATAAPAYDATSVTTALASNSGIDLGIADQQVGTWWIVFQLTGTPADSGMIIGCQADDGVEATTGWHLVRNGAGGAGRLDIAARGMTNPGRGLDNTKAWPLADYPAGTIVFAAIASDAFNVEGMLGGRPGSTVLGQALGTVTITAAGTAGDTLTINGVSITLVANGAAGAQVNIGAALANTAANLVAYINANSAALGVTAVQNTVTSGQIFLSANVQGAAGNAVTLAKASTAMTLSGATLAGAGGKTPGARNVGLSNVYSVAAQYKGVERFFEVGFTPNRLSLAQMQGLYAETKARLAAQGVAVK